jgi:alpha-mannosidase
MLWTSEKLSERIKELNELRYRQGIKAERLYYKEDLSGENGAYPEEAGEWKPIRAKTSWFHRDMYAWIAADMDVPADWKSKKVMLRVGLKRSSGMLEGLLFLNGEPFQGIDMNHLEVMIPPHLAGTTLQIRLRLWFGLNGFGSRAPFESQLNGISLCWLDEAADDLYYSGSAIVQTAGVLGENSAERHELLTALDRSMLLVDWSQPRSDSFYESVGQAREKLKALLQEMPPKSHSVIVQCIGHTHIDVAWLWQLKHTREKAARSFSTVLRLMEAYPEYVFLQTQPQLYEYIQSDYPALYEQIKERIAEGRWEADGAMWLEADCNLTSGESLVRQMLYGMRFLQREFGKTSKYLWLPDVFGYSWALPQILRKCGIETFMTTKISWNQYNRMPHDTFRWRGMDGTEILTHFITTPVERDDEEIARYTYNGKITPRSVTGIWDEYQDKTLNRHLLLAYGYGDGGGGVNREMLEMRRRLADMPGLPQVTTGLAGDYFAQLNERIDQTDQYVHTWDGELYLELHRGTYTSQAYTKRMNRRLELLMKEAEWLHCLDSTHRSDWSSYPQDKLYEAWKIILRNQFHDIIPGSSIREVYEDSRMEYDEAWKLAAAAAVEAVGRLALSESNCARAEDWACIGASASSGVGASLGAGASPIADASPGAGVSSGSSASLSTRTCSGAGASSDAGASASGGPGLSEAAATVFNSASWSRTEPVAIPASAELGPGVWHDAAGNRLPAQRTEEDGWLVQAADIPSCGSMQIAFTSAPDARQQSERQDEEPHPFVYNGRGIATPYYELEWNESGSLCRIYDKLARREVLGPGAAGNELQIFEDKPKGRTEAWDIDLFYLEKMRKVDQLAEARLVEAGPLRAVVRFRWTYMRSAIEQDMIVYTISRRIDFKTKVDWHEQRQLLKAAFPVAVRATEATYDIQFGNVKRPTHWNTSWDYARFETVGHQWADLSESGYGVSLLNDCKYGYDIKDNVLRLSLIKSAIVPDDQADQGEHLFTYALLPHCGDWREGGTVREAWALNSPATASWGRAAAGSASLFRVSASSVMVDAVKKAEDSDAIIVRLHEFHGGRSEVRIESDWEIAGWQETDLLEQPTGEKHEGPFIVTDIAPYEIKTFVVHLRTN